MHNEGIMAINRVESLEAFSTHTTFFDRFHTHLAARGDVVIAHELAM